MDGVSAEAVVVTARLEKNVLGFSTWLRRTDWKLPGETCWQKSSARAASSRKDFLLNSIFV